MQSTKEMQKHTNYYEHESKKYKQVTESKTIWSNKFCRLFPIILPGIGTAIQEGFKGVENCNVEKGKIDTNANKIKQHISTLRINSLNSRKQAFFQ